MPKRGLFIPSRFDVAQARKDLEAIRASAKQAGANIRDEFLKGNKSVSEFIRELRKQQQAMVSAAREAQQRGLIDPKQFAAVRREANRTFNEGILPALAQMRKEGKAGTAEFQQLQRALKHVGNAGATGGAQVKKGFTDQLKDLPALVKGAFGGAMIASFTYVAGKIVDTFRRMVRGINTVLQEASTAAQIREGFTLSAGAAGLDPTKLLAELRRGTRGMVNDIDLMRRANRAMQAELPITEKQMGDLAQVARRLADITGGDAGDAFASILEGLARGETRVLRGASIFTTMTEVLQRYEAETGKSSEALTDQQRKVLLLNAVLEEGGAVLERLGDKSIEAGERVQQMTTYLQNLKTATFEAIANSPKLVEFLGGIGNTAEESAAKVQDLANRVGALVDTLLQAPDVSSAFYVPYQIGRLGAKGAGKMLGAAGGGLLGISGADYEHNLRKRQIQTADLAGLYKLQADAEYRFREMQADGVQAGDVRLEQLREELALMKERAAELQRQAEAVDDGGGDDGPPGLTPDELEKLQEVVKEYRDSVTSALDKELAQLREVKAAMEATGDVELLPGVERRIAELEQMKQKIRDLEAPAAAVTQAFMSLGPKGIQAITDGLQLAQPALKKYEATMLRLKEQLARGIISDKQFRQAEKQAAKELNDRLLAIIAQLREMGKLTPEVHTKLVAMLEEGSEEASDFGSKLKDVTSTIVGVARGVLSVADAMGTLDDETRRTLQGVVDLAEGLGRIASGDVIGGVAQGIGGFVGLITGLAGASGEERERARAVARRQVEAMASLERALRDLEHAVLSETSEVQRNQIIGTLGPLTEELKRLQSWGMNRAGVGPGLSPAELQAIQDLERLTGITVIEDGKYLIDNFLAAIEALQEMDLGSFGSDLHGQLDSLGFVLDILGEAAGTATQRLERFIDAIEEFAPDFAAQLRQRAAADPEAAQAWIAALAEAFATEGLQSAGIRSLFGTGLTADQVRRLLEEGNEFLRAILDETEEQGDGGGGETPGSTRSWTKDFTVTEVTAQRLGGYLSTISLAAVDARDYLRDILEVLLAGRPAAPPASSYLPAAPAGGNVIVEPGAIQLSVDLGIRDVTPENAAEVAQEFGTVSVKTIDEGLGRLAYNQQRVTGRSVRRLYVS
jgi:DNA repair exonuclease SbcCD ATPase subunit